MLFGGSKVLWRLSRRHTLGGLTIACLLTCGLIAWKLYAKPQVQGTPGISFMALYCSGSVSCPVIEAFNTTTTCTTAAAVGANCNTAAITLPAAFPDTNYRLSVSALGCAGSGGAVMQTTKTSASQFTITLVSAAASGYSCTSFDVIAAHL